MADATSTTLTADEIEKRYGEEEAAALPCPFCGATPKIMPWHGGQFSKRTIACENDDCDVSPCVTGATEGDALKRWNRRAPARAAPKSKVHYLRRLHRAGGPSGTTKCGLILTDNFPKGDLWTGRHDQVTCVDCKK